MQTIDVTGLPEPVVRSTEQLVRVFRQNLSADVAAGEEKPTAEAWVAAFRAWAAGHPKREVGLDDDRESIYAGRDE